LDDGVVRAALSYASHEDCGRLVRGVAYERIGLAYERIGLASARRHTRQCSSRASAACWVERRARYRRCTADECAEVESRWCQQS
jgi:hypothetical protein